MSTGVPGLFDPPPFVFEAVQNGGLKPHSTTGFRGYRGGLGVRGVMLNGSPRVPVDEEPRYRSLPIQDDFPNLAIEALRGRALSRHYFDQKARVAQRPLKALLKTISKTPLKIPLRP